MYLKISNKGIVDPEAFSLIGASTKRGDSTKIGMFGSGNKYAISYLFRNNYEFHVFSGKSTIDFNTEQRSFKEQDFQVITINNVSTSITTEMGPDWTLWKVIREFYSNAIDEGLIDFKMVDEIDDNKIDNETAIYIKADDEIINFYNNVDEYFAIDRKVLFENEVGKIYRKISTNSCFFRKGIKCYQTPKNSIFDYDFNDISITEDRVVSYSWNIAEQMWKLLSACDNQMVIRQVIQELRTDDYYEDRINDGMVTFYGEFSSSWDDALKDCKIAPRHLAGWMKQDERVKTYLLPRRLYTLLISKFGEEKKSDSFKMSNKGAPFVISDMTKIQEDTFKSVMQFFKECNYEIPYDIRVVDFKIKDIHGGTEASTILIGINALDQGKTWTANVIIEEFIHIKYDAADETRKFQNSAIGELINYMKVINANNL